MNVLQVNERLRVLIVDDEPLAADTLALILNQRGFDATAVYSGETAVEAAKVLKPNVLISDVCMLGMTGIEAAVRIWQNLPNCKVILISGQAADAELFHCAEVEGLEFELLDRPVHPTVFLDRLGGHATSLGFNRNR